MSEQQWLAERFEEHRARLRAVAYRMLGSASEADDAVQEAWIRLSRADAAAVENLGGWLTTVVGRVSLDMLRSRRSRREEPLDVETHEPVAHAPAEPEHEAVVADSVGLALLVVLDTLEPAERLAFVLHDMFGVPFDEIAPIVGRTPVAARKLASRARQRVRRVSAVPDAEFSRRRHVVDAFLAASREGDFDALLALLDPEAALRADAAAVRLGATPEARGARAVAETFAGRARGALPALLDGSPGVAWAPGGSPRVVFAFTISDGRITGIDLIADEQRLKEMDVAVLAR